MYLGRIVEYTDKHTLFTAALHPYTESLLLAVPVPDPRVKRCAAEPGPRFAAKKAGPRVCGAPLERDEVTVNRLGIPKSRRF
jgi:ABC-type dipeptide/oligopeptide/nickel transport system ATPase component